MMLKEEASASFKCIWSKLGRDPNILHIIRNAVYLHPSLPTNSAEHPLAKMSLQMMHDEYTFREQGLYPFSLLTVLPLGQILLQSRY
jgi:hypothetical protein